MFLPGAGVAVLREENLLRVEHRLLPLTVGEDLGADFVMRPTRLADWLLPLNDLVSQKSFVEGSSTQRVTILSALISLSSRSILVRGRHRVERTSREVARLILALPRNRF